VNHILFSLLPLLAWLLGAGVCWGTCKLRKVHATALQCLIIAGLPLVLGILPLPFLVRTVFEYAIMVAVTMKYLGVSLLPDGLLIPLATEAVMVGLPLLL
jgi:hypothetical protein